MFEEHHPHKFIPDLHFIDIFMDSHVNVAGKAVVGEGYFLWNFFSSRRKRV